MTHVFIIFIIFVNVFAEERPPRVVMLVGLGAVSGEKYWNGDLYEFYGVPYATVPKGRDRFKVSK